MVVPRCKLFGMLVHVTGARLSAFLFAIMSATLAATIACGGDDNEGGAPNDPGTSQTATVRAGNAPESEGGTVRSGSLGYSADLPEDWTVLPSAELPQGLQDQFISPDSEQFPATIQVRCLRDASAGATTLTETARVHPEATPGTSRTVNGQAAISVRYTAGAAPTEIEREDVVFSTDRCAWVISFLNAPGKREERAAEFEQFLNSFDAAS